MKTSYSYKILLQNYDQTELTTEGLAISPKYFIFSKVMTGCAMDSDDVLLLLSLWHIEPLFASQLESWLYLVCAMANASMESGDPVYGPAALALHSQEIKMFHKILSCNLQTRQTQSLSVI